MMNPAPPPKSNDPDFVAVSNLLRALSDPQAAASQLAAYATKAQENATAFAELQAAQEKHAADTYLSCEIRAARQCCDSAKTHCDDGRVDRVPSEQIEERK